MAIYNVEFVERKEVIMSIRNCEVMQYVKFAPHLNDEFILDVISKHDCIDKYAFILHDKDKDKDNHYHIFLKFKSPQQIENVAKWFNVENQYVNKLHSKFDNAVLYCIHKHDLFKYQYDHDEVKCNFDYVELIDLDDEDKDNIDFDKNNIAFYLKKYRNNAKKLKDIKYLYDNYLLLMSKERKDRSMKVIYISGMSGSGKTTFAKSLAYEKYGPNEVFISSSSNDVLDSYTGEKCIILDDFRGSSMRYDDLLKFLDNNTSSTVKSRYNNKQLVRCELVIITSTIKLTNLYEGVNEDKFQLYRRISEQLIILDKGKDKVLKSFVFDRLLDHKDPYKKTCEINITAVLNKFFEKFGNQNVIDSVLSDLLSSKDVTVYYDTTNSVDLTDDDLPF